MLLVVLNSVFSMNALKNWFYSELVCYIFNATFGQLTCLYSYVASSSNMKLIILIFILLAALPLRRIKERIGWLFYILRKIFYLKNSLSSKPKVKIKTVVACSYCGVYFPASEAFNDFSGAIFCSIEHRDLRFSDQQKS